MPPRPQLSGRVRTSSTWAPGSLVDWQFHALGEELIQPFDPSLVNQATVNMRIGNHLVIELEELKTRMQHFSRFPWENIGDGLAEVDMTSATELHPVLIEPHQWLLTQVAEKVAIPNNFEAQVYLRSSAARAGWNHATACYVDSGFSGVITLELINYRSHKKLKIYPGQELVQLKVTKLPVYPSSSYKDSGRYFGDTKVQPSRDQSV